MAQKFIVQSVCLFESRQIKTRLSLDSRENFTESTYLPKNNLLGFDDISQHGIKGRKEIRFEQFAATIHDKFRTDCLQSTNCDLITD